MKRIIIALVTIWALLHTASAQEKILLLNEGNWQADNGRVTYFEDDKVVSNKWFRDKNGTKLGDTPNDIIQINDDLVAIALNWSNIIQFIKPDGTAVAATEDVPNNRKLASDGNYLYVSSYGHECGAPGGFYKEFTRGYVAKIDIKTFKIVDAVEVGYEPEGIALFRGYLLVANTGGYAFQEAHEYETTVSVINTATMKVEKVIDTEQINLYGKMSQTGKYLCINSPGDYYNVQACTIIMDCEKAIKGEVNSFVKLPYAATYSTATRDGKFLAIGSRYSYITSDYTFNYITIDPASVMATNGATGVSETLPGTMLSDIQKMMMPYGIYVNPYTGYMYGTDAASFAEGGTLYQWSPEGQLLGTHSVYINPAHFLALPPDGHFTGIKQITTSQSAMDSDIIYNLSGQRVNKNTKGWIIRGNKKYYLK